MGRESCPRCGSDIGVGNPVERGGSANHHATVEYECGECGWSNIDR